MGEWFHILREPASSILSRTTGFIAAAGFTHSLTPARNCTFGCTYCYVPTMRIQGGLKPDDWRRWGQFTTYKSNAADLLRRSIKGREVIYCSPLVDPYQPAEQHESAMPGLLEALIDTPPLVFTIQPRGCLILRDLPLLTALARRTTLRVSFSLTTDREDVRRWYEPHCDPIPDRIAAIRQLIAAHIDTYATLAPILPCDPIQLTQLALDSTHRPIIGDPFHTRHVKRHGATTRPQAAQVSRHHGFDDWHQPGFQQAVVERIACHAASQGRQFAIGPEAFQWLAQTTTN